MELSEEETALATVEPETERSSLSPRELAAYEFVVRHKIPPLSPVTQAAMFEAYLNGIDCVEIARLNPGISLGQIVWARVDGTWDEKRQEHIESLLNSTRARLQQTHLESADFVMVQLAAAHKQYGDAAKKFLQTGDPKDLGTFGIHGPRQYKETIELLKTLTTPTKKGPEEHLHKHEHKHEVSIGAVNRPMTPGEARTSIKAALEIKRAQKK